MRALTWQDEVKARVIAPKHKTEAERLREAIVNIRAKVNRGATPQDVILLCDQALKGGDHAQS